MTSPNVVCGSSPVQRYFILLLPLVPLDQSAPVVRFLFFPFRPFPSISRILTSLRDRRSYSRHGMRCDTARRFTIPASSPTPGTVSRSVLRILNCSLLWLKGCRYRVVSDSHSFIYLPQIAPLPFWLCLLSIALLLTFFLVVLYPVCPTSPPFLPVSSPSQLSSLSAFHLIRAAGPRWPRVNHRTLHALPSHITPRKGDIESDIVAAREGWRANGKNPLNDNYNFCLYMTHPVLDHSVRTGPELSRVGSVTLRVVAVLAELKRCNFCAQEPGSSQWWRWAELLGTVGLSCPGDGGGPR